MTRRLLAAATGLAVGAALAGAGCGGDGTLDRSEVLARGDRACGEADDRIRAIRPPAGADGERRWRERVAEVQVDLRSRLEALRDEAPTDVAADLEPALAALDDHVAALRAGAGGSDAALARAEEAAARAARAFTDAGFRSCGQAT